MLTINCDGGSRGNPGPAAAAFIIKDSNGEVFQNSKYLGVATNNIAEYSALLESIKWLIEKNKSLESVFINMDSELVVNQLNGKYKIKNQELLKIYLQIKDLESKFKTKIIYNYVPRNLNSLADKLVNKKLDEVK